KAQIAVAEKDHLLVLESINTEVYSKSKEPSEVDNGNLIEQPNEKKDGQKLRRCLLSEDE
ncbi:17826_t:CDS:2, partial [Racocetra persica]